MVHSMTAFSRQDLEAEWGSLQLELRSVKLANVCKQIQAGLFPARSSTAPCSVYPLD